MKWAKVIEEICYFLIFLFPNSKLKCIHNAHLYLLMPNIQLLLLVEAAIICQKGQICIKTVGGPSEVENVILSKSHMHIVSSTK